MNLDIKQLASEISNALATTGENYTVETINLCDETSYEITKHSSTRKLYITPVEDGLIDIVLFNEKGNALATGTLFDKNDLNITVEELVTLITRCF